MSLPATNAKRLCKGAERRLVRRSSASEGGSNPCFLFCGPMDCFACARNDNDKALRRCSLSACKVIISKEPPACLGCQFMLTVSISRKFLGWLNTSEELAFIVTDGPGRWIAVPTIQAIENPRICLWHVPSGPLPLLHPQPSQAIGSISDPWAGWEELRAGADSSNPYFGAGTSGDHLAQCPTKILSR